MLIQKIPFANVITNNNQTQPVAFGKKCAISYSRNGDLFTKTTPSLTPEEKFKKASKFAKELPQHEIQSMSEETQEKLEGIQYGLKTFEGMKFKEIYFILSNAGGFTIPLYRDCAGRCAACYLNGRPKDNTSQLERMDYDDYKNLTQDLKVLTNRINFDCKTKGIQNAIKHHNMSIGESLTALFYDSDSKDTWLKDKDGVVHEFPELNKMLYDATGIKGLFDTAGWSPKNTKVQERVERTVDYFKNPEHVDEILQINVSLNTYHGLMKKANDYKAKGDIDGYHRMRNQYVKNVANAMYTMTPLLDTWSYNVMVKCVDNSESDKFAPYKEDVCNELRDDVLETLRERFLDDFHEGNTKFVKSYHDIHTLVGKHLNAMSANNTYLSPSPKDKLFADLYNPNPSYIKYKKHVRLDEVLKEADNVLIDLNGKVYFTNDEEVFETNTQLNFKNKDKESKQIYPIPDKRKINIKKRKFVQSNFSETKNVSNDAS